jgi:hypothetical protein
MPWRHPKAVQRIASGTGEGLISKRHFSLSMWAQLLAALNGPAPSASNASARLLREELERRYCRGRSSEQDDCAA